MGGKVTSVLYKLMIITMSCLLWAQAYTAMPQHNRETNTRRYHIHIKLADICTEFPVIGERIVLHVSGGGVAKMNYPVKNKVMNTYSYNQGKSLIIVVANLYQHIQQTEGESVLLLSITVHPNYQAEENTLLFGILELGPEQHVDTRATNTNSAIFKLVQSGSHYQFKEIQDRSDDVDIYELGGLYCKRSQQGKAVYFNCNCLN